MARNPDIRCSLNRLQAGLWIKIFPLCSRNPKGCFTLSENVPHCPGMNSGTVGSNATAFSHDIFVNRGGEGLTSESESNKFYWS
jgi:hypothetical protein